MFDKKYYLDLVTQDPINYNGLIIYQPSFMDIKQYGLENYDVLMYVHKLTLDCFGGVVSGDTNLFEDIILKDKGLTNCLTESLYMFTKPEIIYLSSDNKYLKLVFNKNDHFIINADNFNDISDILLKINATQKIKIEKPPENMSDRQKDVWKKLQEGRQRDENKNELHLYDMLNICEFGGDYHIPISVIKDWSLWRIMNCYKTRVGWKGYCDNLQIALISHDDKNISGKNHWYQQLMIRE
ncbi:MAG: hypothetical protein K0S41_2065 [Anaerocolumna sp.]|jgi:hypothetical protein|nr:hypothetical protein [Anaerocolumna sp.]